MHVKLRSDLEIRNESSDPRSSVIIKDPITHRFYRFTPVQGAVLRQLDGDRESEAVAENVARDFQTPVLASQVEDFAGKLQTLLLLDHPAVWAKLEAIAKPKHCFLSNLLSIRVHAYNPEKLFTKLERVFRFCFKKRFTACACLSVATASIVSILNWESLFVSITTLLSLYSIPLVLIVAFAVMTLHEFAHGVALKHFGGKVEEMGLLVLYFIPAFYCNVSDAWMMPRRQRILVTLAGGYVQIILWAWATIMWRLVSPETLLSRVCLIAIAFSGVQTLFNFNPLIRLDGYYLLSDYLRIPNLRPKSYRFLKARLGSWISGVESSFGSGVTGRERRVFVVYGITSFLFSAGLLLVMLQRLGGWMVQEYQGWGVLLFSALCFMAAPVMSRENVTSTGRLFTGAFARFKRAPRWIALLALLVVGGFLPWELKISAEFTILPNKKVSVSPQEEGTLRSIAVDEGSRVRCGDVVAELQNLELSTTYEETKGELEAQKASLQLLQAGSRPEEIERAKSLVATKRAELYNSERVEQERSLLQETVAKRQAQLRNAQADYERIRKLLNEGLVARSEADRDRTIYEVAQKELSEAAGELRVLDERTERARQVKDKELKQAQSELTLLQAGSRREAIEAVQAQVRKLEEKLNIFGQQLEHLQIRSPIDGIIATPYLKNRIGEYMKKGDRLCDVVSEGVVIVEMPVPEKEIGEVHPGNWITMKVRGYPNRSFEARVMSIAPVALEKGLERTVMVQGELTNTDGILKAGMTGVGKVLCGKRTIAHLVTRRLVRWLRTEFWEYLP